MLLGKRIPKQVEVLHVVSGPCLPDDLFWKPSVVAEETMISSC